jgi:hypothetical protein
VKNLLPIACAVSAVMLFFYCLNKGRLSKISNFEWGLIVLDCLAILIWWWYQSAIYANIFLMATAFVSFIPLILHTWVNPMVEDSLPWSLWTIAYFILTVVVIMRWEKWEDLVYPVTFLMLHLAVAFLALDRRVPNTIRLGKV